MPRFVSVAVPVPALDALTYSLPEGAEVVRGARALVPLGSRLVTGCVLDVSDSPPDGVDASRLKPISEVLDGGAFLPDAVVGLAQWVSSYYLCGIGDAIAAAMPPFSWVESEPAFRLTAGADHQQGGASAVAPLIAPGAGNDRRDEVRRAMVQALADGSTTRRVVLVAQVSRLGFAPDEARRALQALLRDGTVDAVRELKGRAFAFKTARFALPTLAAIEEGDTPAGLTSKQQAALALLRGQPSGVALSELEEQGASRVAVSGLVKRGLAALVERRVERDPFEGATALQDEGREAAKARVVLTDEQAAALARLTDLAATGMFGVTLLHGVTGSGKTEVYRRLASAVCAGGRRVLMLVPEIALTPAVAATLRHTFGERVAIQHSALSEGERHDQWHRIRRGDVDVVVGTRSAVFAPMERLGLVIVDEEHDTSYKQEESPRYHGRDVAIVRAQRAGALVVLGSATPALESFQNARSGRYELISLTRRVLNRPLARVTLVNMRDEYASEGPDVVVSRALREAIGARLSRGEQAVVLLNRRGYAAAVLCRACGNTMECPNCSVSLTYHKRVHRARCHYCDFSAAVPETCSTCGGEFFEYTGVGTERVEAELTAGFAGVRIARVDRDTIRRRGEITRVLDRFARRELDVLVGTQMIAKGHDFPAVTLVGVISADVGLGLADFRAGERTFQLLTQVSGRAGRGETPGEALIQTLYPDHYSIRLATTQDYEAFFERELRYRTAMHYPPAHWLISVVVRAPSMVDAMRIARRLADDTRRAGMPADVHVVGPAPAPLSRLRGDHRAQFFVKGTDRNALRAAVRHAVASRADLRRQVTIDVDPLSVL